METDATIATPQDYAHCWQIMQAASKNYTFASRVLPRATLPHVAALYAFLRVGDDRVDVAHPGFATPEAAIADWEAAYWRAFATGASEHPVLRAYLATTTAYHIPPEIMRPYFRAMQDDLRVTRYATFEDLLHYMDGSAVPVGRAMTYILGVRPPCTLAMALPYADSLAIAMQLSNFWRDIGEDWQRGRLYIPQTDMAHFAVSETAMAQSCITPQWRALLEFEFARTEHYYTHARQGIAMLATGQWAVFSGWHIYRALLAAIRRQDFDVFTQRAGSTSRQKIGHLFHAAWEAYDIRKHFNPVYPSAVDCVDSVRSH